MNRSEFLKKISLGVLSIPIISLVVDKPKKRVKLTNIREQKANEVNAWCDLGIGSDSVDKEVFVEGFAYAGYVKKPIRVF